jgi:hypothetical protein
MAQIVVPYQYGILQRSETVKCLMPTEVIIIINLTLFT